MQAQRALGLPAWEAIRPCAPDPENEGRFLYNPAEWGFGVRGAEPALTIGGNPEAPQRRKRKRVLPSGHGDTRVADAAAGPEPGPPLRLMPGAQER